MTVVTARTIGLNRETLDRITSIAGLSAVLGFAMVLANKRSRTVQIAVAPGGHHTAQMDA